jgi:hypothetical protein
MTTIRAKPEELEVVAKHIPDAENACCRARTSLSWELPSLVMDIPGIGSAAIQELTDELLPWLRRYEEKLNEAEELLYGTAAAMHQADQTLADNMKEFGLELLGWYDVQRLFEEYDPIHRRTDLRMGPTACGRNVIGFFSSSDQRDRNRWQSGDQRSESSGNGSGCFQISLTNETCSPL